jgi:hypothetical protein
MAHPWRWTKDRGSRLAYPLAEEAVVLNERDLWHPSMKHVGGDGEQVDAHPVCGGVFDWLVGMPRADLLDQRTAAGDQHVVGRPLALQPLAQALAEIGEIKQAAANFYDANHQMV